MILLVDSGSTKSDWRLLQNKLVKQEFSTMGFNPFFHNEESIIEGVKQNVELFSYADQIEKVFFYGAGCSSEKLKSVVARALQRVFINAEVSVDHDLAACAYATYNGNPAISCILGTGSNSCYFDGENIMQVRPAIGYILGDEGSGSYFGKTLLRDFLYNKLPLEIASDLRTEFDLSKDEIFKHVYQQPYANVYLASFMKFIFNRIHEPYFQKIVINGMHDFLSIHVSSYENFKNLPVHFVGSVAYFFKNELLIAANDLGITVDQIIRKPIHGLINYHQNF